MESILNRLLCDNRKRYWKDATVETALFCWFTNKRRQKKFPILTQENI